jgi:hypothetical protein
VTKEQRVPGSSRARAIANRDRVVATLRKYNGNVTRSARRLRISRSTLVTYLKLLELTAFADQLRASWGIPGGGFYIRNGSARPHPTDGTSS